MGVGGLAAVGNYVLAQDGSGAWATHYVFNASGTVTDQKDWNYTSREYAWDPVTSRVYFFRDNMSPGDLHYEVIDQTTGKITSSGETPYHGNYTIQAPIRVSANGQYVLLGSGDIYNQAGLTLSTSLGKTIADAQWKDNLIVDVDTTDRVEIRDAGTRAVLASYQYLGQPIRMVFGQADAYLVHVMNNTTTFLKLPFGDQDLDSLPKWWEQLYGLSDSNAADAAGDLDGDGVSNASEYLKHSNPLVVDSDSDGLTDYQEIVTYLTDPARADSESDGLSDKDEVVTYQTDPWLADTDGDGYHDVVEVLQGGNPTDPSGLPQPLLNYSQSFESNPLSAAWTTPQQSSANWTIDPATSHSGSASLKSGASGNSQYSSIQFRAYFSTGQLSFHAKADTEGCCDRLYVLVDGVQRLSAPAVNQWNVLSVPLTVGVHNIEWRYLKDSYGSQGADAVWIDDVAFVGQ
jgi:thrombospondin type 3 repeat protein